MIGECDFGGLDWGKLQIVVVWWAGCGVREVSEPRLVSEVLGDDAWLAC